MQTVPTHVPELKQLTEQCGPDSDEPRSSPGESCWTPGSSTGTSSSLYTCSLRLLKPIHTAQRDSTRLSSCVASGGVDWLLGYPQQPNCRSSRETFVSRNYSLLLTIAYHRHVFPTRSCRLISYGFCLSRTR